MKNESEQFTEKKILALNNKTSQEKCPLGLHLKINYFIYLQDNECALMQQR